MLSSTHMHAGIGPEMACMPAGAAQMLRPVVDCLQRALPGIPVQIGSASTGQILTCRAPQPPVRELVEHLRHAHPEAGPHYWSARAYSLLVWQPAYVAVLSVHLAGVLPSLQGLGQECCNGFVWGMTLPTATSCCASVEAMIPRAGHMLAQTGLAMADSLAHEISIHPKFAARLLADYIVAALLLVQRQHAELDNTAIRHWANQWLEAAGLTGCSDVMSVQLNDGQEHLALKRRACCQHFRRHDGGLCSTCPKLKPEERLVMIKRELVRPEPS